MHILDNSRDELTPAGYIETHLESAVKLKALMKDNVGPKAHELLFLALRVTAGDMSALRAERMYIRAMAKMAVAVLVESIGHDAVMDRIEDLSEDQQNALALALKTGRLIDEIDMEVAQGKATPVKDEADLVARLRAKGLAAEVAPEDPSVPTEETEGGAR